MTRPLARHLLCEREGKLRSACGRAGRQVTMGTLNPMQATCRNCMARPQFRRALNEIGRAVVAMAQGLSSVCAPSAARTPDMSFPPA